jgi:hypothetical protein
MKRLKIILCLLALFLLGAACGALLTARWARQPQQRAHWEDRWVYERMKEDAAQLKLSPEQVETVRPLCDQLLADIRKVREETGQGLVDIAAKHERSLSAMLTPEQQSLFEKLTKSRRSKAKPNPAP